jgi:hypothetical protein
MLETIVRSPDGFKDGGTDKAASVWGRRFLDGGKDREGRI